MQNEVLIHKKEENDAGRLACKQRETQGETPHVPVPCDQSYLEGVIQKYTK